MTKKIDNFGDKINTNGFDKNPDNIGGGRKPKIYTILKDKGYSKDDIKACFGELGFYTKQELNEVLQNEELPIIQQIVANQFLEALKGGDWGKIKEILEHSIGKPLQHIETKDTTIRVKDVN